MKKYLLLICSVLLISAVGMSCNNASACPKIGDKAPDFTLNRLDGSSIKLNNLTGKSVLINTWDLDCIECKKEMPLFQELSATFNDKLVFISLDTGSGDSISEIKDYLSANKYTFDVYRDSGDKVFKPALCLRSGNPCTVFINKEGYVQNIKIGSYATKSELEDAINALLK